MTTIYHLIVKGGNIAAHHYYTSLTALHLAHADILPSKSTLDRCTFPIFCRKCEVWKGVAYTANEVRATTRHTDPA